MDRKGQGRCHPLVLPFLYPYGIWTAIWNAAFELAPIDGINFGLRRAPSPVTDPGVGPWYVFALALYFVVAKVLSPVSSWSQLAIIAAALDGHRLLMRLPGRTTWVTVAIAAGVWGFGMVGVYLLAWPFGQYLFVPLWAAGIAVAVTLAAVLTRATFLGWFGRRRRQCDHVPGGKSATAGAVAQAAGKDGDHGPPLG